MNSQVQILKSKTNCNKNIHLHTYFFIKKIKINTYFKVVYLIEPFYMILKSFQEKKLTKDGKKKTRYKSKDFKNVWVRFYFVNVTVYKKFTFLIFKIHNPHFICYFVNQYL